MATTKKLESADAKNGDENAFPLSLNEFCIRLSQTDKRVEMIGAFNAQEAAAGRHNDTEAAYEARYADFITQPA